MVSLRDGDLAGATGVGRAATFARVAQSHTIFSSSLSHLLFYSFLPRSISLHSASFSEPRHIEQLLLGG